MCCSIFIHYTVIYVNLKKKDEFSLVSSFSKKIFAARILKLTGVLLTNTILKYTDNKVEAK